MPSYPCAHPTCSNYVARRGDGCPEHVEEARRRKGERHRRYDATRDPRAKQFYNSSLWQRARKLKLATDPVCERCGVNWARHVHHEKPLLAHWDLRLEPSNLRSACIPCHNAMETENREAAS